MAALLLAANALASLALANASPVNSATEACSLVKSRYAALNHFPMSRIGFCDMIRAYVPRRFYVLILHSTRRCDYICSSWLGSFAVERSSGRVFEWNTGEWELGPEVRQR